MDDQLYTQHLQKLWFQGRTRLRYYTSDYRADSTKSDSWEAEDDILECISHQQKWQATGPALTLIAALGDGRQRPISATDDFFTEVINRFEFPRVFVQSVSSNQGSLASFVDYEMVGDEYAPAHLSIIIHTPYSPLENYSIAIRVDVLTRVATCLLLDFREEGIDGLLGRLRIRQERIQKNPLEILAILFEQHCFATEKERQQADDRVVSMERKTGMTSLIGAYGSKYDQIDHEKLVKDLHACNTDLIFLDTSLQFEAEMGSFCRETVAKFEALNKAHRGKALPAADRDAIFQRIDYYLDSSRWRRTQALSLMKRVKTQINVLYSLISQRDSRINQQIAEAAMRDSKTMKTIAVMTLVFLPGTLVASIFSAGIFDLRHKDVAPLWWTFVVATVLLTFVVLASWVVLALWTKKNERRNDGIKKSIQ